MQIYMYKSLSGMVIRSMHMIQRENPDIYVDMSLQIPDTNTKLVITMVLMMCFTQRIWFREPFQIYFTSTYISELPWQMRWAAHAWHPPCYLHHTARSKTISVRHLRTWEKEGKCVREIQKEGEWERQQDRERERERTRESLDTHLRVGPSCGEVHVHDLTTWKLNHIKLCVWSNIWLYSQDLSFAFAPTATHKCTASTIATSL